MQLGASAVPAQHHALRRPEVLDPKRTSRNSPQPKTFPATLRLSMSGFGKRLSARVSTLQPNRKM
eukprot:COSAG06_NODE_43896_length_368_cov_0.579926_2_plen_64_part_01